MLVVYSALTCSGDRTRHHSPIHQLHEGLGRPTDNGEIRLTQEVHVRAWIHLTQNSVHIKRVSSEVNIKALGQNYLKDVARTNVFLCNINRRAIRTIGHRRTRCWQVLASNWRLHCNVRKWTSKISHSFMHTYNRIIVCLADLRIGQPCDWNTFEHVHALTPMVECGKRTNNADGSVRQIAIITRNVRKIFYLTNNVITKVTH